MSEQGDKIFKRLVSISIDLNNCLYRLKQLDFEALNPYLAVRDLLSEEEKVDFRQLKGSLLSSCRAIRQDLDPQRVALKKVNIEVQNLDDTKEKVYLHTVWTKANKLASQLHEELTRKCSKLNK